MASLEESPQLRQGVRDVLRRKEQSVRVRARQILSFIDAHLTSWSMSGGIHYPDGRMASDKTATAMGHVEDAMGAASRAAEMLRVHPVDGAHQSSPRAYYELNRIWTELDSLRKRMDGGHDGE